MNEIPVYLFTGFMDSGKTSLIKDTLFAQGFAKEGKSLVICCEDGDVEFTEEELTKNNVKLVMVEKEEDFTEDFLNRIQMEYQPEQVFLEYNGTWQVGPLFEMELPKHWMIVQQLATVDATTFDMYRANMRAMIMEQLFSADVVIFNRCDDDTDKGKYRRNIDKIIETAKSVNSECQIIIIAPFPSNDKTAESQELIVSELKKVISEDAKTEKWLDICLVDMYHAVKPMLEKKNYYEISANNINHPNDFIHRYYAMNVLSAIFDF